MTSEERTSAAMKDISKKSLLVKNSGAAALAKPSNDLMGSLTDEFHTANEVARKSQVPSQAPTTGVKAKVANPKPVVKEVDDSFTCCGLFSRKKAEAYAAPAVSTTTSKDTAQAIADISRRSRQVQQTNAVARASGKSTSLMDEITDQFHEQKEAIDRKSGQVSKKAGEVWD